jgi:hypothetical protein
MQKLNKLVVLLLLASQTVYAGSNRQLEGKSIRTATGNVLSLPTGTTDTLVGRGTTDTLTNKTLTTPNLDIPLFTDQGSTPATPASGKTKFYSKTDGKFYKLTSAGTEQAIGSGSGSGGINYLTDSSTDFETSVGNWLAYADAAASSPVDGTGGSPSITCTRTTTTPLRGTGSLLITKGASNRQGDGCAVAFSIDKADLAKSLTVGFDYEVASGTYDAGSDTTDSDLTAWVYGPTDGTPVITQLAGYKVLGGSTGTQMRFQGRFQTASSGVAYRLILHEARTGASAYTVKVDNIVVGPDSKSYGAPITDWVAYTPTFTGLGSPSSVAVQSRRVGDTLEVRGAFQVGTTTAVVPTMTLGFNGTSGNVTIDSSKVSTALVGKVAQSQSSATYFSMGVLANIASPTTVIFSAQFSTITETDNTQVAPSIIGSGNTLEFFFAVPILGWSSTVQMSNDADTRVVAANYTYSAAQTFTTGANVTMKPDVKQIDTHNAFDTSTGVFTVPVPGIYRITASTNLVSATANTGEIFIVAGISGNEQVIHRVGITSGNSGSAGSVLVSAKAGQQLRAQLFHNNGADRTNESTVGYVSFERISGPNSIAASEPITVSAVKTSSSASGTGLIDLVCDSVTNTSRKEVDSHGIYNTSTGIITIPSAGTYEFSATAILNGTKAASDVFDLLVTDSSNTVIRALNRISAFGGTTTDLALTGIAQFKALAGDQYKFRVNRAASTLAIYGHASDGFGAQCMVKRVGN